MQISDIPTSDYREIILKFVFAIVIVAVTVIKLIISYVKAAEIKQKQNQNLSDRIKITKREVLDKKQEIELEYLWRQRRENSNEIDMLRKKQVNLWKTIVGELIFLLILVFINRNDIQRFKANVGHAVKKAAEEFTIETEQIAENKSEEATEVAEETSSIIDRESEKDKNDQTEFMSCTPETEINPESTMKLDVKELNNGIDYGKRRERVYFGLMTKDSITKEVCYKQVKRAIMDAIFSKESSRLNNWDETKQIQVLELTGQNDDFNDEVKYRADNPVYWKGTEKWYKSLPAASTLINIIDIQEIYLLECPDIEFNNQLYNNYWNLAQEYVTQGWCDGSFIVQILEQAGFHLLEKLKYEEITIDNAYKTLNDLRGVYVSIEECEQFQDLNVQEVAGILKDCIEQFIEEELVVKDERNDPIVMEDQERN